MSLLWICKKYAAFVTSKTQQVCAASSYTIVVSKENDQVLQKLGFAQNEYKRVLPKKRTVRQLDLPRVLEMLTRLGFTHEEIRKHPNILWLHPFLIDHRFKLLEESGIDRKDITLKWISKFTRLAKTVICELKKTKLIRKETDVVHNILSFSDIPSKLYPPRTNDIELLGNAQTTAVQTYISWKLGLTMEEVKMKYESYEDLHQKSIRLAMQSYNILTSCYELSEKKIIQNMYLFEGHPDNFLEILEKLPKLGDSTIQQVASINTKILIRPVYKMLKVIEILKKYNIPEDALASYSTVLTLSPETVKERAAVLYADPVIQPFFCSPRILCVIARYHTSLSRYRVLEGINWRCPSIQLLTTFDKVFQRTVELGQDETRGSDVCYYIKKHLGHEIKEIRKQLRQNPLYFLIPLSVVTETLQYLLENKIDKTEIFKALPIVLYPREKVARWLLQVNAQPEVRDMLDKDGKLPPSLVLQLVLYYMERPYQFSGHGVWTEKDFHQCSSSSVI